MVLRSYAIYGEEAREVDPGFAHVEKVNDRRALHRGVVEPHSHPHLHQLSLWHNGQGTYQIEDGSHFLQGTMLTWVPSSTLHGFTITGDCDAFVVSVSEEFVQSELAAMPILAEGMNWREAAALPVPDAVAGRIEAMFRDVAEEYASTRPFQQQALTARTKLVFIEFARLARSDRQAAAAQGGSWPLYQRFRAALDKHGDGQDGAARDVGAPTVAGIARDLGTTPYLLNKAVRAATGIGPAALIRRLFVQKAKRLLLFTELKVASVGFALGVDDPAHFGRLFHRETGVSPKVWRERERAAMSAGKPNAGTGHG